MHTRFFAAALVGAFLVPAAAQAQSRVAIPNVELFATVTGKWVLDPRRCRDIREDIRDARKTTSRRDRREDRRDQRVAACPASSYDFVPDAGQGPKYPVRVGRGRVSRKFRGQPMFINGDTIGPNGGPLETRGQVYAPAVQQPQYRAPEPAYRAPPVQPAYQQPAYQQPVQQPTYQAPTYQTAPNTVQQPTYQAPTYQQPAYQQPAYQAPAPAVQAPTKPSSYRIINGVFVFD